jgi:PAS domain S-box-containing protein
MCKAINPETPLASHSHGDADSSSLLAAMADGVVLQGSSGVILAFNDAAQRLLGLSPEDLSGRFAADSRWRAINEDGSSCTREDHPAMVTLRTGVPIENRVLGIRTADGKLTWLSISTRPLTRPHLHQPYAVVSSFHDITARKAAEDALHRNAHELEELYHSAPCGYHSLDRDGLFLRINDTELKWLGYRRDEVVGRLHVQDLLTPERREQSREALSRYLAQGHCNDLKLEFVTRSGATLPVLLNATSIKDEQGRFVVSHAVVIDIRERDRHEQEILDLNRQLEQRIERRTAELAEAVQELEAFSYSVSHDLQSPVRVIGGLATLLLEEPHLTTAEAQRHVGAILKANQRQAEIIDDLLRLARVSRHKLERVDLDLSGIAGEVVEELRAAEPHRSVIVRIQPDLGARADAGLMRIAFVNLIGNAWKFTRERITAEIEIGSMQQAGKTMFYVRDNGAGFDMQHAQKLFTPFARQHAASEFEGSGIGLATVQRVVRRHGGKVWLDSHVDLGTAAYFTLDETL